MEDTQPPFDTGAERLEEAADPSLAHPLPNMALVDLFGQDIRAAVAGLDRADDEDGLVEHGRAVQKLCMKLLAEGVAAGPMTRIVAALNERLTCRVIAHAFEGVASPDEFSWLALGSQARYEQTFSTDQDNAILFPDSDEEPEAVRARLLPTAQRVNRILDRCGFELCPGDIMAGNPRWCLSETEWRDRFARWIDNPSPEALMHGAIFFDFRRLHGLTDPVERLRVWLFEQTGRHDLFMRFMAEAALRNAPPLGTLRQFRTRKGGDDAGTLDIKVNGVALFTDAARILGLAAGVPATNTLQRLSDAALFLNLDDTRMKAWQEAFLYLQTLRLRHQYWQGRRKEPMSNRINPGKLNGFERAALAEALKQARDMQKSLAHRYQL
ncbi:MAG: DUF294 nucleotidyltransferase-like domain-containing protein [Gammaproteobacteria bacterium]